MRYRLDYYGDDIPKYLDEDTTERLLMNSYHTEDVQFQIEQLRQGVRVHIRSGWYTCRPDLVASIPIGAECVTEPAMGALPPRPNPPSLPISVSALGI